MNYVNTPTGAMPASYYNILSDLPVMPDPMLNPGTMQPVTPEDMAPLFPAALLEHEMTTQRFIPIPQPVMDAYAMYRPTPLRRALRLERELNTPAKIFFKYEGASPTGSHKANTAIPQAYFNMREGIKRLATETGAGQWGSALAQAGGMFGLEVMVYMVNVSYRQKPSRRTLIETFGATITPSPSKLTAPGRKVLARDPECDGSLGIAISEAVSDAMGREDTHYSLGSVLNHVLLHQTVIGLECREQMRALGEYPDTVIGCHGGGSNLGGIALPFVRDMLEGRQLKIMAAEPASCPTLTRGKYAYDFGDNAGMTPLARMHTLGHGFIPSGIHAGGLRYHGAAPIISRLVQDGLVMPRAYPQGPVFEAAMAFAQCEGIVPAPESAHAIRAAMDEAIRCREEGREETVLFCLSGHGYFDLAAYEDYMAGRLVDDEPDAASLDKSLGELPGMEEPERAEVSVGVNSRMNLLDETMQRSVPASEAVVGGQGFIP